jgi:hypothetical protein
LRKGRLFHARRLVGVDDHHPVGVDDGGVGEAEVQKA